MRIKGAIFDVDGTLIDSMGMWYEVGSIFVRSRGYTPEPDLPDILFRMSGEEGEDYICKTYPGVGGPEEIRRGVKDILQDYYANEADFVPGALELLNNIKDANIPMTVATSSYKDNIVACFKRLGILDYFSAIVTCEEVGKSKRDPLIFNTCAEIMGTAPGETAVFEDIIDAVRTANNAGFITIGVYDSFSKGLISQMKVECNYYFEDLKNALDLLKYGGNT